MKRKVLIGLVASSLLVTPFIQSIPVTATDFDDTSETIESSNDESIDTVESTVASDVFSEPFVSVTEVSESETVVEPTNDSSSTESSVNQELLESSTVVEEDIQYEDVFYNGQ